METPSIPSDPHVFAIAGLPGSGKTTAAEMIRDELEYNQERAVHAEVSDFCRALYSEHHDGTVDDNDLGRWTAELKEEHGRGYILREMAETLDNPDRSHLVISGLRSPEEVTALEMVFGRDTVTTLSIWTLPDKRFERKYGDKPSSDHPKWDEFQERNERELHDWGGIEFFLYDGPQECVLPNNGCMKALQADLSVIVRDAVWNKGKPEEWREGWYPFPNNLSPSQIASYL